MPKKDGAFKRLEEAIALAKLTKLVTDGRTVRLAYRPLLNVPSPKTDQINPAALMRLDEGNDWDRSILAAFEAFDLDHRYLGHWRMLLTFLASIHFSAPRRRGRKTAWTEMRLLYLLMDFQNKKERYPEKSNEDIYRFVARERSMKSATVKKKLREARKSKFCSLMLQVSLK